jgi:signal transduction histidine kinase
MNAVVHIGKTDHNLIMQVKDDGKGFDLQIINLQWIK